MTNMEIIEASKIASGIPADTLLLTFNEWKRNGFMVKKGEHARLTVRIWKPRKYKAETKDGEEIEQTDSSSFYLAKAFLFDRSQVEAMEVKA